MKNYTAIKVLTLIVTLLCLYNLSFTFVAQRIERKAADATRDKSGAVNYQKKQAYLDSIWHKPVFNVLGLEHTYKEVKENELNLGLDLQGGIYMVLEVSPAEIIRALSGSSKDPAFNQALAAAHQAQQSSNERFTKLFLREYLRLQPNGKLSRVFSNTANRGRISHSSTNEQVMALLDKEVEDAIDRSFEIIQSRIDKFGTSSPNIQKLAGTGRIQVELPGVDNPERVRKLLSGVAKLEFAEVWENQELSPVLEQLNTYLNQHADDPAIKAVAASAGIKSNAATHSAADSVLGGNPLAAADTLASTNADSLAAKASPLFQQLFVATPDEIGSRVTDTANVNRLLRLPKVQAMLPSTMAFAWDVKPVSGEGKEEVVSLYALKKNREGVARMTGEVISDARLDFSESGQPEVSMQMNTLGARQWKRLTGENIGKQIAIVLDNKVYSAPVVQSEIPNGSSSISGRFSVEEAKDLANILKAGKLPAPTRIVEESVVGPSLGQEAISQGLLSLLAGLALIITLMIGYYGSGGAIANVALFANVFLNVGILAQLHSSLTLPGIAGIVLTIGMSVDANVLIYERIREELRNGVDLKRAIELGFSKAYSSILDANITTFIIGAVLYAFGSGGVKGFATTLMVGIACSLFTAVFVTRIIVEKLASRSNGNLLSFDTPFSKNLFQRLNFNFVGRRKLAYLFSAAFISVGILSVVLQGGLNLGVDFKGGRSYVVRFEQPVNAEAARVVLASEFENAGTEVKTFGGNNQLKITTSYLIEKESAEADQQVEQALLQGLSNFKGAAPKIMSSAKVGATIADDIAQTAQLSVVLSLGLIFLYILVRFRKWQYSLGAVIALFHDVLFVISAFALARWFGISFEVDQVFIAAILTIIGYSINDTVVIFDRIREFAGLEIRSKKELATIVNDGINATLSRSIMTSLTVLLVVVILLLFGGDVLRGFSFALVVGVIAGSYSTIFIAAPIVIDFVTGRKEPVQPKIPA